MKYIYTILLLSLVFTLVNCDKNEKNEIVDNSPAVKVRVAMVSSNKNKSLLSLSGKIQASKSADLSTRMMGFVDEIYVNIGDKVRKGQLLITINNTDLKAKKAQLEAGITQAKTAFNNAEKNYKRFKNLFSNKSISQKEMDDMSANFEMTKARLASAYQMKKEINAQFVYSNIKAPFDGVITAKNIEKGNMASPGIPLISIESPNDFEVITMVPESEISQITKGTSVDVLVKSIHKKVKGNVARISASAKNTGGQYLVKINLEKNDVNILSGMFATVKFPVEGKAASSLILLPIEAIVKKGQLSGIYTVSETNTALLRWLRLGRKYGDKVEVLSGLAVAESYVLSAEGKLFNGAKISIQ